MVILSTFIGLPVSVPLATVSLAGVSVSGMAIVLTSKYQKKLTKIAKLGDDVISAISVLETGLSKAMNNGEIEEQEFQVLQELQLKVINELANINRKMELETRTGYKKVCWKR